MKKHFKLGLIAGAALLASFTTPAFADDKSTDDPSNATQGNQMEPLSDGSVEQDHMNQDTAGDDNVRGDKHNRDYGTTSTGSGAHGEGNVREPSPEEVGAAHNSHRRYNADEATHESNASKGVDIARSNRDNQPQSGFHEETHGWIHEPDRNGRYSDDRSQDIESRATMGTGQGRHMWSDNREGQ